LHNGFNPHIILLRNFTAPNEAASTSATWGGDIVAVGGKIALMPITLGTSDFMVHHIHAFTIHVTVLILLKGVLFARSSRLIPDKANLGFRFPCDGPGRGEHVKFQHGIMFFLVYSGCITVYLLLFSILVGRCSLTFGKFNCIRCFTHYWWKLCSKRKD
jgi:photosystem I P700 chlorophyll a apoprotein A1